MRSCSMVPKSKFQLMKNDQIDYEPYEKCIKCYRRWHTLCAVYNKKVSYHVKICMLLYKIDDLQCPVLNLSEHLIFVILARSPHINHFLLKVFYRCTRKDLFVIHAGRSTIYQKQKTVLLQEGCLSVACHVLSRSV